MTATYQGIPGSRSCPQADCCNGSFTSATINNALSNNGKPCGHTCPGGDQEVAATAILKKQFN